MAAQTPSRAGTLLGVALDDVTTALRGARRRALIATPFLSLPVAQLLVRASGRTRIRRLLTAVNVAAVEGGYLDPLGVRAFIDAGFEVRSLRNLHAKVVLVDDAWGLVGSGNLTAAGLDGGNAELGIVLSPAQARRARREHFEAWWSFAEAVNPDLLDRMARTERPSRPERRQRQGHGGVFPSPAGKELESFARDPRNSGYWLKIMYGDDELTRARGWRRITWISDAHVLREGRPTRRPGYAIGDHLVTYLSRVGRPACPAVLRVTAEPVYDPARVAREAPGDEGRWGWLTEVELVHAVDLARAPTLAQIDVAARAVNQHGHIRLSPAQYRKALARIA